MLISLGADGLKRRWNGEATTRCLTAFPCSDQWSACERGDGDAECGLGRRDSWGTSAGEGVARLSVSFPIAFCRVLCASRGIGRGGRKGSCLSEMGAGGCPGAPILQSSLKPGWGGWHCWASPETHDSTQVFRAAQILSRMLLISVNAIFASKRNS